MSLDLKVTLKAHTTKWRERFVNVKPSTTGCYLLLLCGSRYPLTESCAPRGKQEGRRLLWPVQMNMPVVDGQVPGSKGLGGGLETWM